MQSRPFAALVLLLCACRPDGGHCPLDDVVPHPADGSVRVSTNTWTHVDVPDVVALETGLAMYADGVELLGTTTWDDFGVYFQPNGWYLPPEAEIEVWLERPGCADELVSTFTTSRYGEPFEAGSLDERVYLVDLAQATQVQPADTLDPSAYGTLALLLRVNRSSGGQLQATAALPETEPELKQDPCAETLELPVAEIVDNPGFEVTLPELVMPVDGYGIRLLDVEITGFFSADGTETGEGHVLAKLDAGSLDPLVGGDFCGVASAIGITCEPCPRGGSQCITVEYEDVSGVEVDVDVVDVSAAEADEC